MSRLFICLWPPDGVVRKLEELHRKDSKATFYIPPNQWHVTLRFLGDADPNDVAESLATALFRPARIRLGPAVDVWGGRILLVPVQGGEDLAAETARVTRHLGVKPLRQPYKSHLTIARLKRYSFMPRTLGEPISAEWTATDVALVRSTLRQIGAVYDTFATFPTRPRTEWA